MAEKDRGFLKRIKGVVGNPFENLSPKSPEAEPVLITDLTIEEQREREEKIELEVALRDVTPEGCRVNELMIKGIFLDFERLKHYSKKDQKELRDLYKKRSFSSLSRENKFMVIEELAKF